MAEKPEAPEIKKYFSVHVFLLKWSGIRLEPFEKNTHIAKKILMVAASVTFVLMCPVMYVIDEALEAPHLELEELTYNLSYCITHSLGLIKILIFTYKRKQIWKYCQTLETGRMKPNIKRGGKIEYTYVKDAIRQADRQAYFFHYIVFMVLSLRAIATHSEYNDYSEMMKKIDEGNETISKPPTAFLSYIPFKHNKSPVFGIVCAYQLFNAWLYGIYIGSIDTILTGIMIHAKAQFLILKNLLAHIVEKAEQLYMEHEIEKDPIIVKMIKSEDKPYRRHDRIEMLPPAMQKYARRIANKCAKHHLDIINMCMSLENEISSLMLVQMIASVIMLCFNLFQLSLASPGSYSSISTMFYLVLMGFQLWTYCWNGNEVIIHSSEVMDACFQSDWIVLDGSCKQTLLLMMMRSQRPIKLTAAKFTFLSLETYMSLLKGSASYFMFLKQMR